MRFCLLLLFISGLMACQSAHRDQYPDGSVQVKIPLWVKGSYQIQVVDLITVRDMQALEGDAAQFILSPRASGDHLVGSSPRVRTIRNADGVYVATDELSLELLTTYYHMENLKALDDLVGASNVNTWPRKVAISDNVYDPVFGQIQNNALYSIQFDAILMMPYTRRDLPMAVNGGILGHEHFHSLFQKIVLNPLADKLPLIFRFPTLHADQTPIKPTSQRDFYHTYLLRGLNEGLADFWGWLYSEDDSFVGRSLSEYKQQRNLSSPLRAIPDQTCFAHSLYMDSARNSTMQAYEFGTQIAIWQKELVIRLQTTRGLSWLQTKKIIGPAMIRALRAYSRDFANMKETDLMEPGQWVEVLLNQIPAVEPELRQWSAKIRSDGCKRR